MSVRNYSVKNYSKIAPCPPSSKTIAGDRIASRRVYDFRSTNYKANVRGGAEYLNNSDTENEYPNKQTDELNDGDKVGKDKPKEIAKLSSNMNTYSSDYLKNKMARPERGIKSEHKIKITHGRLNDSSGRVNKTDRDNSNTKTERDNARNIDHQADKPLRPKSARPESRWQRRLEPDETDTISDTSTKPSRPKSARPESRMMRMIEAHPDVDYNFIKDLPERPKTSHGRRRSVVEDEVEDASSLARPKSRLGRNSDVLVINDTDSDSEIHRNTNSKPRSDNSRHTMKGERSNQQSKTKRNTRIKSEGDTTDSDNTALLDTGPTIFGTGSTMFDLNSKIDDIDLDVDPVEYFMQDNNNPPQIGVKKHSLSTDTIKHIGSTRKSNHGKAITSCHDYYQNKTSQKGDISDRYHRNDFQSPQYSISESNQSRFNQEPQGKINQRSVNALRGTLTNGDGLGSRGNKNGLRYSKAEVSRDILAKYTALSSGQGYLTQTNKTSSYRGEEFRRKPRKLDPIIPSNMKPY